MVQLTAGKGKAAASKGKGKAASGELCSIANYCSQNTWQSLATYAEAVEVSDVSCNGVKQRILKSISKSAEASIRTAQASISQQLTVGTVLYL